MENLEDKIYEIIKETNGVEFWEGVNRHNVDSVMRGIARRIMEVVESKQIEVTYEQLKNVAEMHERIIKPWRAKNDTEYAKGWNDCIKEVKKNHKGFLKYMDEKYKLNS